MVQGRYLVRSKGGALKRADPDARMLPNKLPVKYYAAIGELITAWAHLEFNIERLIWALLGLKMSEGRLLTTGMQARPKLELLKMIGPRYTSDKNVGDSILRLCKEAAPLAAFRNDVAHGIWVHPRKNKRLLHIVKVTGAIQNRIQPVATRYTDKKISRQAKIIRRLAFDARWASIGVHLTPRASGKKSIWRAASTPGK